MLTQSADLWFSNWSGAQLGWAIVAIFFIALGVGLLIFSIIDGEAGIGSVIMFFCCLLSVVIYVSAWDGENSRIQTEEARSVLTSQGHEVEDLSLSKGWVIFIEDSRPTEYGLAEYRDVLFVLDLKGAKS